MYLPDNYETYVLGTDEGALFTSGGTTVMPTLR